MLLWFEPTIQHGRLYDDHLGCPVKEVCCVCECDPCDCGWGSYVSKNRNVNRIYLTDTSWWETDGNGFEASCLPNWDIYDDCVEHIGCIQGIDQYARSYQSQMPLAFGVGQPVRYFPNCNLANDEGIWLIKDVVNKSAIECSWYDYEITNGLTTVLCRQEELMEIK